MQTNANDTIAAIATPPGIGGVGIVRVSGPEALAIARRIFRRSGKHQDAADWQPESHRLYYGHAIQPRTGQTLDEALLAFMRGPHSYTAEDVVEIQGHGGPLVLRRILDAALSEGARLANPGEMTLRAFLNGRIDLAQAEAVMDVIGARTDESLSLALAQLRGRLSEQVQAARQDTLGALAQIEASIDFPDDVSAPEPERLRASIEAAAGRVARLLAGAEQGRLYREGLRVAIIGRPNVGKSSLLNALLRAERAIVTPIAGTTRDTVEEYANVRGIPVQLIDTAGINETSDPIEQIGVQRSRAAARAADLVLLVLDASEPLNERDEAVSAALHALGFGRSDPALQDEARGHPASEADGARAGRPVIVVLNKSDLPQRLAEREATVHWPDAPVVRTSMITQDGLEALEEQMRAQALAGQVRRASDEEALVTNTRHRDALRRTAEHLSGALETLQQGLPFDFVAIDLHGAANALGEITGETATEDLLERIFHDFCLGK
ncbi:MAG TPA: tRNA uridine-5-carboxymethylaminomethyl(34) synthesis GTPase MnmE [Ktedonobacterales bacterium]|jgi:tRNA modification GTPase